MKKVGLLLIIIAFSTASTTIRSGSAVSDPCAAYINDRQMYKFCQQDQASINVSATGSAEGLANALLEAMAATVNLGIDLVKSPFEAIGNLVDGDFEQAALNITEANAIDNYISSLGEAVSDNIDTFSLSISSSNVSLSTSLDLTMQKETHLKSEEIEKYYETHTECTLEPTEDNPARQSCKTVRDDVQLEDMIKKTQEREAYLKKVIYCNEVDLDSCIPEADQKLSEWEAEKETFFENIPTQDQKDLNDFIEQIAKFQEKQIQSITEQISALSGREQTAEVKEMLEYAKYRKEVGIAYIIKLTNAETVAEKYELAKKYELEDFTSIYQTDQSGNDLIGADGNKIPIKFPEWVSTGYQSGGVIAKLPENPLNTPKDIDQAAITAETYNLCVTSINAWKTEFLSTDDIHKHPPVFVLQNGNRWFYDKSELDNIQDFLLDGRSPGFSGFLKTGNVTLGNGTTYKIFIKEWAASGKTSDIFIEFYRYVYNSAGALQKTERIIGATADNPNYKEKCIEVRGYVPEKVETYPQKNSTVYYDWEIPNSAEEELQQLQIIENYLAQRKENRDQAITQIQADILSNGGDYKVNDGVTWIENYSFAQKIKYEFFAGFNEKAILYASQALQGRNPYNELTGEFEDTEESSQYEQVREQEKRYLGIQARDLDLIVKKLQDPSLDEIQKKALNELYWEMKTQYNEMFLQFKKWESAFASIPTEEAKLRALEAVNAGSVDEANKIINDLIPESQKKAGVTASLSLQSQKQEYALKAIDQQIQTLESTIALNHIDGNDFSLDGSYLPGMGDLELSDGKIQEESSQGIIYQLAALYNQKKALEANAIPEIEVKIPYTATINGEEYRFYRTEKVSITDWSPEFQDETFTQNLLTGDTEISQAVSSANLSEKEWIQENQGKAIFNADGTVTLLTNTTNPNISYLLEQASNILKQAYTLQSSDAAQAQELFNQAYSLIRESKTPGVAEKTISLAQYRYLMDENESAETAKEIMSLNKQKEQLTAIFSDPLKIGQYETAKNQIEEINKKLDTLKPQYMEESGLTSLIATINGKIRDIAIKTDVPYNEALVSSLESSPEVEAERIKKAEFVATYVYDDNPFSKTYGFYVMKPEAVQQLLSGTTLDDGTKTEAAITRIIREIGESDEYLRYVIQRTYNTDNPMQSNKDLGEAIIQGIASLTETSASVIRNYDNSWNDIVLSDLQKIEIQLLNSMASLPIGNFAVQSVFEVVHLVNDDFYNDLKSYGCNTTPFTDMFVNSGKLAAVGAASAYDLIHDNLVSRIMEATGRGTMESSEQDTAKTWLYNTVGVKTNAQTISEGVQGFVDVASTIATVISLGTYGAITTGAEAAGVTTETFAKAYMSNFTQGQKSAWMIIEALGIDTPVGAAMKTNVQTAVASYAKSSIDEVFQKAVEKGNGFLKAITDESGVTRYEAFIQNAATNEYTWKTIESTADKWSLIKQDAGLLKEFNLVSNQQFNKGLGLTSYSRIRDRWFSETGEFIWLVDESETQATALLKQQKITGIINEVLEKNQINPSSFSSDLDRWTEIASNEALKTQFKEMTEQAGLYRDWMKYANMLTGNFFEIDWKTAVDNLPTNWFDSAGTLIAEQAGKIVYLPNKWAEDQAAKAIIKITSTQVFDNAKNLIDDAYMARLNGQKLYTEAGEEITRIVKIEDVDDFLKTNQDLTGVYVLNDITGEMMTLEEMAATTVSLDDTMKIQYIPEDKKTIFTSSDGSTQIIDGELSEEQISVFQDYSRQRMANDLSQKLEIISAAATKDENAIAKLRQIDNANIASSLEDKIYTISKTIEKKEQVIDETMEKITLLETYLEWPRYSGDAKTEEFITANADKIDLLYERIIKNPDNFEYIGTEKFSKITAIYEYVANNFYPYPQKPDDILENLKSIVADGPYDFKSTISRMAEPLLRELATESDPTKSALLRAQVFELFASYGMGDVIPKSFMALKTDDRLIIEGIKGFEKRSLILADSEEKKELVSAFVNQSIEKLGFVESGVTQNENILTTKYIKEYIDPTTLDIRRSTIYYNETPYSSWSGGSDYVIKSAPETQNGTQITIDRFINANDEQIITLGTNKDQFNAAYSAIQEELTASEKLWFSVFEKDSANITAFDINKINELFAAHGSSFQIPGFDQAYQNFYFETLWKIKKASETGLIDETDFNSLVSQIDIIFSERTGYNIVYLDGKRLFVKEAYDPETSTFIQKILRNGEVYENISKTPVTLEKFYEWVQTEKQIDLMVNPDRFLETLQIQFTEEDEFLAMADNFIAQFGKLTMEKQFLTWEYNGVMRTIENPYYSLSYRIGKTVSSIFYLNKLASPKLWIFNTADNALNYATGIIERAISNSLEKTGMGSAITNAVAMADIKIGSEMKEMALGFKDVFNYAVKGEGDVISKYAVDFSEEDGQLMSFLYRLANSSVADDPIIRPSALAKANNIIENLKSRTLSDTENFLLERLTAGIEDSSGIIKALRTEISKTTEEEYRTILIDALSEIESAAMKAAMTNDNALVSLGKKIQNIMNFGLNFGLGNVILPFYKVSTNFAVRMIDYSPIAFGKFFRTLSKIPGPEDILKMSELEKRALKEEYLTSFARGIIGTGTTATIIFLYKTNIIGFDKYGKPYINTTALKRAFNGESTKLQDGDYLIQFDVSYLGNLGTVVAEALYSGQNALTEGSYGEYILGILQDIAGGIAKQTYLGKLSGLLGIELSSTESKEEIQHKVIVAFAGLPASLIPQVLKDIRSWQDEYIRRTYSDDVIEMISNKIKNAVPGLSEDLKIVVDESGNPLKTHEMDLWLYILSPVKDKIIQGDQRAIDQLQFANDTGYTEIMTPSIVNNPNLFGKEYQTATGVSYYAFSYTLTNGEDNYTVVLKKTEKDQFQKDFTEKYLALSDEILSNDDLTPEEKKEQLLLAQKAATESAIQNILTERKETAAYNATTLAKNELLKDMSTNDYMNYLLIIENINANIENGDSSNPVVDNKILLNDLYNFFIQEYAENPSAKEYYDLAKAAADANTPTDFYRKMVEIEEKNSYISADQEIKVITTDSKDLAKMITDQTKISQIQSYLYATAYSDMVSQKKAEIQKTNETTEEYENAISRLVQKEIAAMAEKAFEQYSDGTYQDSDRLPEDVLKQIIQQTEKQIQTNAITNPYGITTNSTTSAPNAFYTQAGQTSSSSSVTHIYTPWVPTAPQYYPGNTFSSYDPEKWVVEIAQEDSQFSYMDGTDLASSNLVGTLNPVMGRNIILAELSKAQTSIKMAMYGVTDAGLWKEITEIIKERAMAGVQVQIVTDEKTIYSDQAQLLALENIKAISSTADYSYGNPNAIMHNKYFVIDGKTVITGSMNISQNSLRVGDPSKIATNFYTLKGLSVPGSIPGIPTNDTALKIVTFGETSPFTSPAVNVAEIDLSKYISKTDFELNPGAYIITASDNSNFSISTTYLNNSKVCVSVIYNPLAEGQHEATLSITKINDYKDQAGNIIYNGHINNTFLFRNAQIAGAYQSDFDVMYQTGMATYGSQKVSAAWVLKAQAWMADKTQAYDLAGSPFMTFFTPYNTSYPRKDYYIDWEDKIYTYDGKTTDGEQKGNAMNLVIDMIKSASKVRIFAYAFSDPVLLHTLFKSSQDIEIFIEKDQYNALNADGKARIQLLNTKHPVYLHNHSTALLHTKTIILDNQIILAGSMNYSKNATDRNDENWFFLKNSNIANIYDHFENILKTGKFAYPFPNSGATSVTNEYHYVQRMTDPPSQYYIDMVNAANTVVAINMQMRTELEKTALQTNHPTFTATTSGAFLVSPGWELLANSTDQVDSAYLKNLETGKRFYIRWVSYLGFRGEEILTAEAETETVTPQDPDTTESGIALQQYLDNLADWVVIHKSYYDNTMSDELKELFTDFLTENAEVVETETGFYGKILAQKANYVEWNVKLEKPGFWDKSWASIKTYGMAGLSVASALVTTGPIGVIAGAAVFVTAVVVGYAHYSRDEEWKDGNTTVKYRQTSEKTEWIPKNEYNVFCQKMQQKFDSKTQSIVQKKGKWPYVFQEIGIIEPIWQRKVSIINDSFRGTLSKCFEFEGWIDEDTFTNKMPEYCKDGAKIQWMGADIEGVKLAPQKTAWAEGRTSNLPLQKTTTTNRTLYEDAIDPDDYFTKSITTIRPDRIVSVELDPMQNKTIVFKMYNYIYYNPGEWEAYKMPDDYEAIKAKYPTWIALDDRGTHWDDTWGANQIAFQDPFSVMQKTTIGVFVNEETARLWNYGDTNTRNSTSNKPYIKGTIFIPKVKGAKIEIMHETALRMKNPGYAISIPSYHIHNIAYRSVLYTANPNIYANASLKSVEIKTVNLPNQVYDNPNSDGYIVQYGWIYVPGPGNTTGTLYKQDFGTIITYSTKEEEKILPTDQLGRLKADKPVFIKNAVISKQEFLNLPVASQVYYEPLPLDLHPALEASLRTAGMDASKIFILKGFTISAYSLDLPNQTIAGVKVSRPSMGMENVPTDNEKIKPITADYPTLEPNPSYLYGNSKSAIIQWIKAAQSSIVIITEAINDPDIIAAIQERMVNGVNVGVIGTSNYSYLTGATPPISMIYSSTLTGNFIMIDNTYLIWKTGDFQNFTQPAVTGISQNINDIFFAIFTCELINFLPFEDNPLTDEVGDANPSLFANSKITYPDTANPLFMTQTAPEVLTKIYPMPYRNITGYSKGNIIYIKRFSPMQTGTATITNAMYRLFLLFNSASFTTMYSAVTICTEKITDPGLLRLLYTKKGTFPTKVYMDKNTYNSLPATLIPGTTIIEKTYISTALQGSLYTTKDIPINIIYLTGKNGNPDKAIISTLPFVDSDYDSKDGYMIETTDISLTAKVKSLIDALTI